jgi:hypothetical protein
MMAAGGGASGVAPAEHSALLAEARRLRAAPGAAAAAAPTAAVATSAAVAMAVAALGDEEGWRQAGVEDGQEQGPARRGGRWQQQQQQQQQIPLPQAEPGDGAAAGGQGGGSLLSGVQFFALESREPWSLSSVAPCVVVVYDVDLALVRRLEVYKVGGLRWWGW